MNNRNGFTLIELLVVISIIALLLSILMPSLSKVKQNAKNIVCASRLKQQGISMMTYAVDNGKYPAPPFKGHWPFGGLVTNAEDAPSINIYEPAGQGLLIANGYIEDLEFFYCPASPKSYLNYENMTEMYQQDYFDSNKVKDIDWRNLYINYPYWISYARERQGQSSFDNLRKNVAKGPNDKSDKVIITDNAITTVDRSNSKNTPPHKFSNHVYSADVLGCNVLKNDGSVVWNKMQTMKQNEQKHLQINLGSFAEPINFWF